MPGVSNVCKLGGFRNTEDKMKRHTTRILLIAFVLVSVSAVALEPPEEPLHKAALAGNVKKVKELIDEGVDVNKLDGRYGCTALHIAAGGGHLEIVKVLRKAGARIYVENKQKEPLIFAAVSSGNLALVKYLLAEGASKKSTKAQGENLIHHVILGRTKEMLPYLIEIGVDVEAKDKRGRTPLHTVAYVGDFPVTRALIKAGANVNATTWHNETPLHLAASYDHEQAIRDLLEAGADCNLLDDGGRHPLFGARSVNIAKLLLEAGAKPNVSSKSQYTPLSGAVVVPIRTEASLPDTYEVPDTPSSKTVVVQDRTALARCLIKAGADVNMRIDHDRTAIFNVISADDVEMFKLLVESGASLDIKSDSGETPLDWVAEYGAVRIKKYLNSR